MLLLDQFTVKCCLQGQPAKSLDLLAYISFQMLEQMLVQKVQGKSVEMARGKQNYVKPRQRPLLAHCPLFYLHTYNM